VHRADPARLILSRVAAELGVPLRHCSPAVRHCGDFYGQSAKGEPLADLISTASLIALLRGLPEGITELGCHPGYVENLETMYRTERAMELRTLCAGQIRSVLEEEEIRLVSFLDLHAA
jgi:predicted glycoside hydrolase/deacetylase ChbG (UPF0249 family)